MVQPMCVRNTNSLVREGTQGKCSMSDCHMVFQDDFPQGYMISGIHILSGCGVWYVFTIDQLKSLL